MRCTASPAPPCRTSSAELRRIARAAVRRLAVGAEPGSRAEICTCRRTPRRKRERCTCSLGSARRAVAAPVRGLAGPRGTRGRGPAGVQAWYAAAQRRRRPAATRVSAAADGKHNLVAALPRRLERVVVPAASLVSAAAAGGSPTAPSPHPAAGPTPALWGLLPVLCTPAGALGGASPCITPPVLLYKAAPRDQGPHDQPPALYPWCAAASPPTAP